MAVTASRQRLPGLLRHRAAAVQPLHGLVNGIRQVPHYLPQGGGIRLQLGGVLLGGPFAKQIQSPVQGFLGVTHVAAGLIHFRAEILQLGQERLVIAAAVPAIQQLPQSANSLRHAVRRIRQAIRDGGHLGNIPLRQKQQIVDGIDVVIREVAQPVRQGMGAVQGIIRIGGDAVHPGGHGIVGSLGVIQHPVHQALQTVDIVLQGVQAGTGGL